MAKPGMLPTENMPPAADMLSGDAYPGDDETAQLAGSPEASQEHRSAHDQSDPFPGGIIVAPRNSVWQDGAPQHARCAKSKLVGLGENKGQNIKT